MLKLKKGDKKVEKVYKEFLSVSMYFKQPKLISLNHTSLKTQLQKETLKRRKDVHNKKIISNKVRNSQ